MGALRVLQALFLDLVLALMNAEDCTLYSGTSECPQETPASSSHGFMESFLLESGLGLKHVLNNRTMEAVLSQVQA